MNDEKENMIVISAVVLHAIYNGRSASFDGINHEKAVITAVDIAEKLMGEVNERASRAKAISTEGAGSDNSTLSEG